MKRLALSIALAAATVQAQTPWSAAQDSHFAVYSQAGDKTAHNALLWFEQLRAFFQQNGLWGDGFRDQGRPALRVVGFRSETEYAEYRLRPLADAYFASYGNREYVVMATLQHAAEFRIAAHEYAHYVMHASNLKLPACFNEGLAEFFSTLEVNENGFELGGDLPARKQTLRRSKGSWLPIAELFNASAESTTAKGRREAEIFYAESWALIDMLMTSPQYAPHFKNLVIALNTGSDPLQAFRSVYGKSLTETETDLENWVGHPHSARAMMSPQAAFDTGQTSQLSAIQSDSLLAELSLVIGQREQAKSRYRELLREQPDNPEFPAALGAIAQREGNTDEALRLWRQAITLNTTDSDLCYRYALLAEDAVPEQDVKAALERAVFLSPGFDDARYKLALLEYKNGEYRAALDHLRIMQVPMGERRYAYWIALASALLELNQNDEAKTAAMEAGNAAQNADDKMSARRLALIAATDSTVQFVTDSDGRPQIVTTRVPHGTTDWNPFVEPSDQMQHANGKLSEILCEKDKLTGFLLRTSNGTVTLEVADPLHVLMRNSPSEFYCGPGKGNVVEADYAVVRSAGKTRNLLRGMTFQP